MISTGRITRGAVTAGSVMAGDYIQARFLDGLSANPWVSPAIMILGPAMIKTRGTPLLGAVSRGMVVAGWLSVMRRFI